MVSKVDKVADRDRVGEEEWPPPVETSTDSEVESVDIPSLSSGTAGADVRGNERVGDPLDGGQTGAGPGSWVEGTNHGGGGRRVEPEITD